MAGPEANQVAEIPFDAVSGHRADGKPDFFFGTLLSLERDAQECQEQEWLQRMVTVSMTVAV